MMKIFVFGDQYHSVQKGPLLSENHRRPRFAHLCGQRDIPCISARNVTRRDDLKNMKMGDICGADPLFRDKVDLTKFWKMFHNIQDQKVIGVFCHKGQHRSVAAALSIREHFNSKEKGHVKVAIELLDKARWSLNAQKCWELNTLNTKTTMITHNDDVVKCPVTVGCEILIKKKSVDDDAVVVVVGEHKQKSPSTTPTEL